MEDSKIIELYFQRDEMAIQKTKHKYGNYCLSVAYHILDNHEESEECLNETLLKTWNSIPPCRPKYLKLYLAKIIRNCSIDLFKHRHTQKMGQGEVMLVYDELEECIGENMTEIEFHKHEITRMINQFLRNLPLQERNIFIRRYFYVDSVQEISKLYHVKESYVYVILSRTRQQLKEYLMKGGYFS